MRSVGGDLEWHTLEVDERPASCATGGHGLPVVFLHGWGLGHRAYQHALRELMARGCRVYAPALPGFGGTAELPGKRRTMAGYAAWVDEFLDVMGIEQPALVVGHSFGGGVAIRLAHDAPQRVRHLVLINSVGSPTGSSGRALSAHPYDRLPWEYGVHFMRALWSRDGYRLVEAMSEDIVRNVVVNPWAMLEIGALARRVDLTAELAELRRREVPIVVLWGEGDGVLPQGSFDALCAAIGTDGRVLPGGHSWLLANPRALSEVLDNVVQLQVAEHETTGVLSTTAELRSLLRRTNIPTRVVTRLLRAASPLWMMSEQAPVLAADLALCYPPLARDEVRAVARPMEDPATFRLTVVAADRPGLLADSAAALAAEGLTVLSASVATWADLDIALHSLTFTSTTAAVPDWDALGESLRSSATRPACGFPLYADRSGHRDRGPERARPVGRAGDRSGRTRPVGSDQSLVRRARREHRGSRDRDESGHCHRPLPRQRRVRTVGAGGVSQPRADINVGSSPPPPLPLVSRPIAPSPGSPPGIAIDPRGGHEHGGALLVGHHTVVLGPVGVGAAGGAEHRAQQLGNIDGTARMRVERTDQFGNTFHRLPLPTGTDRDRDPRFDQQPLALVCRTLHHEAEHRRAADGMGQQAGVHHRRRHAAVGSDEAHDAEPVFGSDQPAHLIELCFFGHEERNVAIRASIGDESLVRGFRDAGR